MERSICIHGHFYQPPRENPWLEAIEIQDSAYPYHDWNERVTAECYAPNSASRLLDGNGLIIDIVTNYANISFNFGPTLLSWMEKHSAEVYASILAADKQSMGSRGGHGNAIAQVYSHAIMPLANSRDKHTQVRWGISDFSSRFKRSPEGMWLAETAVDMETLEILAEEGIKFTVLAPHQASRVRKTGSGRWKDVGGGRIDPTRAYLCPLPSGRKITIFFYDSPISRAVAFEGLLNKGEDFANRLISGFSDMREWEQVLSVATDGESYGHHHKFGDMALAHALHHIEKNALARLTNYGEFLEKKPPLHEVQILENTSWSCSHGVERWRNDCGCNTGGHPGWNQGWRASLKETLDWLRDELSPLFEKKVGEYLKDPWAARDDYIDVILDRSQESIAVFFKKHSLRDLNDAEKTVLLEAMEIQRHALLMYTSCGWFFDDLSGIETLQIIQYAGRAIQLAEKLFGIDLESPFKERLSGAKSNIPEYGNGALIYERSVKPAVVDLKKVAAHYAVSSLISDYGETAKIFCFTVKREDYQGRQTGEARLAAGRIVVASDIVLDSETFIFSVLHLGGHIFNGGLMSFKDEGSYQSMKEEILAAFDKGEVSDILKLTDTRFGINTYSLINLFRDEQRKVLDLVITKTMEDFEHTYRLIYENNRTLMGFLQEAEIPVPRGFMTAAEFALTSDFKKAFSEDKIDEQRIKAIIADSKKWDLPLDSAGLEYMVRRKGEELIGKLLMAPSDISTLANFLAMVEILRDLPLEINYWQIQNTYLSIAKTAYNEFLKEADGGGETAAKWVETFRRIGELLSFNVSSVLSGDHQDGP